MIKIAAYQLTDGQIEKTVDHLEETPGLLVGMDRE